MLRNILKLIPGTAAHDEERRRRYHDARPKNTASARSASRSESSDSGYGDIAVMTGAYSSYSGSDGASSGSSDSGGGDGGGGGGGD